MEILNLILSYIIEGFWSGVENYSVMISPTLGYTLAITLIAVFVLRWGKVFFKVVDDTLVLMLPGGGLAGALAFPALLMLGFVLITNPNINEGMFLVVMLLQFFIILRFELVILTHVLTFFGSMYAYSKGLKFSIECMDKRCKHGAKGSGNFLHYFACGGDTLLTALGTSPLIMIPVLFGLPDGIFGIVLFVIFAFPYFFVFGKLLVGNFNHSIQKLIKLLVDILMFATEWPGWIISSFTLSIFAIRLMPPKVSPTSFH